MPVPIPTPAGYGAGDAAAVLPSGALLSDIIICICCCSFFLRQGDQDGASIPHPARVSAKIPKGRIFFILYLLYMLYGIILYYLAELVMF